MTFVESTKWVFFNTMAAIVATCLTAMAALFAMASAALTVLLEIEESWLFAWRNLKYYPPRSDHE